MKEIITLAHGEGGWLTRRLIVEHIAARLGNDTLLEFGDAARLEASGSRLAFTTDSFVVAPLFFPGGDIGRLSIFGTVNDLAVSGATPRWISLSFILEEGLPLEMFDRILQSISEASREADVSVVTGDTKVVPRGAADGIFINTAGIGELVDPVPPGPSSLSAGDVLIVTGSLGQHGLAILAAREELGLEQLPGSDCAPLTLQVNALRKKRVPVRAMRDATRGGLAAVLHEWAEQSQLTAEIDESLLPVRPEVRGGCELLGLDPVHVANEGVLVSAVPMDAEREALSALRGVGSATTIGRIVPRTIAPVTILRSLRRAQPLDLPSGALLPRIC
ncbi:MAG: hydrogenase expression/formation protein HypE [Planctomycetaceae bacterium]